MSTFLLDTFTRPAGPLAGTSPNVPGSAAWTNLGVGIDLDGFGFIIPPDGTSGGGARITVPGLTAAMLNGFTLTFDLDMGTAAAGNFGVELLGVCDLIVDWNSPADWAVNFSNGIDGGTAFPSNVPGMRTWTLTYNGSGSFEVLLDGVSLMVVASTLVSSNPNRVELEMSAAGGTTDIKVSRLQLEARA